MTNKNVEQLHEKSISYKNKYLKGFQSIFGQNMLEMWSFSNFWSIYTSWSPLKVHKNWSHRVQWQIKLLKNCSTKHSWCKYQILKRFSVIISSRNAWKADSKSFLVKNEGKNIKKGPKIDHECSFYEKK